MKKRHERLCKALFIVLGLIAIVPSNAKAGFGFPQFEIYAPFAFDVPGDIGVPPPTGGGYPFYMLPDLIVEEAIAIHPSKAFVKVRNIGPADARASFLQASNYTGIGFGFCGPIASGEFRWVKLTMLGQGRTQGCHLFTLYQADIYGQVLELDENNNHLWATDNTTCN